MAGVLVITGVACRVEVYPDDTTPGSSATAQPVPALAESLTPTVTPTPRPTLTPIQPRLITPTPTRHWYQLYFPAVASSALESPLPTPEPEATPTPTPIPTPVWPEPLSAPGPSKLGLHVVRNNSPLIMEFIRRVRPAVVKAVDDVGWLGDVKLVSPETVTIGRLAPTHQDMNGDPAVAAQAFVAEQMARYQLNPGVDYWEGWNEPDPNEKMGWYAAFEAERARLMAQHGFRVAVGGFAAGVPEYDEFVAFIPAIEVAARYGGILTLHEYGAPTLDFAVGSALPGRPAYADRGILALRYRWWYRDFLVPRGLDIPLVISEAGIDGVLMAGQRPGPNGLGWQEFSDYWDHQGIVGGIEGYIRQLAWYDAELRQDEYVIGFSLFTAGAIGQWMTYDVTNYLPQLAFYVAGQ